MSSEHDEPTMGAMGRATEQSPVSDAAARDVSRRTALRWGAAALSTVPLSWPAPAARAAALAGVPTFSKGMNAWPWFVMPLADPPPGEPYPAWPPYDPRRPIPTAGDLAALAAAGFDFIRLVVDPAPFLHTAGLAGSDQSSRLFGLLMEAIGEASDAGLGVIVNVQPGGSRRWNPAALYGRDAAAGDVETFVRFIGTLARRLGGLRMARLALEPVNEPPQDATSPDGAADWRRKQEALLGAARSASPTLTLVATGASGGSAQALQRLDPKPLLERFDPLLFTFHFYEPYLFSHQGAPWAAVAPQLQYRWLNDVPWPAATGSLRATLSAVQARMAADPHTTAEQKRAAFELTTRLMGDYFIGNVDRHYIESFFVGVVAWASGHGIEPRRIVMGEFGALKTTTDRLNTWDAAPQSVTGGPYVAARPADRLRYIADVRATAEDHGFGWAMWTMFNPGMGLITNDDSHALDPGVIAALGLGGSK